MQKTDSRGENGYHLSLKNVSVGYQGVPLIRNIELDVKRGEILTLIGPNGAGKSTILKSITRQLQLVGGAVYLSRAGESMTEISRIPSADLARQMAVMLTDRVHAELMTCYDVAAAGRYPYTGKLGVLREEDEKKVEEALQTVHAGDIGSRPFDAISDGQRQRILLARALCQEPEILILDEPTSYLDIRHKLELLSVLRRMAKERGITIILSLHEIDLAQKISDRLLAVKGETIYGCGTPEELFAGGGISELYEISTGSYDPLFGSVELPAAEGEPQVFVISAGGSGIPVYRRLQKEGTPFAAGILYTNDIDYQAAKYLASAVVTERPFCAISDAAFERAKKLITSCRKVIIRDVPAGECNRRMTDLIGFARSTN